MTAPRALIVLFAIILLAGATGHWEMAMAASAAIFIAGSVAAWRTRGQFQVVTVTAWDDERGGYVVTHHDPL